MGKRKYITRGACKMPKMTYASEDGRVKFVQKAVGEETKSHRVGLVAWVCVIMVLIGGVVGHEIVKYYDAKKAQDARLQAVIASPWGVVTPEAGQKSGQVAKKQEKVVVKAIKKSK